MIQRAFATLRLASTVGHGLHLGRPVSCSRPHTHFAQPSRLFASSSTSRAETTFSSLNNTVSQFKTYKPITPSIRHLRRPVSPHIYEGRPVRLLTVAQRKKGGRGAGGRVSVRSRGGGHKRRIRIVDFIRMEPGIQDVIRIEYDPGRSAHIALIKSRAPQSKQPYSYILACEGLRAGHTVQSFRQGIPDGLVPGFVDQGSIKKHRVVNPTATDPTTPQSTTPPTLSDPSSASASASLSLGVLRTITIKPGNVLPLRLIPTGTLIHAISLRPSGRGILVRSAGSFGQLVSHDEDGLYSQVKLQSGEVRHVLQSCCATVGKVSNPHWKNRSLGKAGRSRWLGRRPHVRGVAMNALGIL
jgi:ribosomal protein L2